MLDERKEEAFCTILREELQLATGCTEPIAVAYCAARLRQVLGQRPCRILAEVSGNILKNVKSVVVPNTGGRRGLPAAIAVGVVAGDPEARLQVIAHVTEADAPAIGDYLDRTEIRIDCPPTPRMLDIRLTGWTGDGHRAVVHVANNHTNIIYVERDGEVLLEKPHSDSAEDNLQDKSVLNVRDILTFAETVDVSRIEESVGRQLECNTAIAREGLRGDWGANIGSTLLLSGGDALLVSDERLEYIISKLREIPHVEIVRIGSRTPVVLPQRITPALCNMLKKYHPVWLNTHFNHPNEITPESAKACAMLADAGIPLGNQSVLLAGINDCVFTMKKLVNELVKIRVRPYYIYQCDLSMGLEHFRTPVSKGIEIIEGLRGHTSGFCVPTFVVDAPGGGGKTPVMPQYIISQTPKKVILRNYEGVITTYTEPEHYTDCQCDYCTGKKKKELMGVAGLERGQALSMEPANLERHKRSHHEE